MATQSLLRPQSAGGVTTETGSSIKYQDGGKFQLKIDSLSVQAQCQLIDATTEEDAFVVHKHTGRVSGQVKITGHIISGKLVGFNNLPDEEVLVHAVLGKTGAGDNTYHKLRFNLAITSMTLQYSRKSATVPIVIEGSITKKVTGTTNSVHESLGTISAP